MGCGLLERSDSVFLDNLHRYLAGKDVLGRLAPLENSSGRQLDMVGPVKSNQICRG